MSLVIAQQYIDDIPLVNKDIPKLIDRLNPALTSKIQGLDIYEVNRLERDLLKSLEYHLYVSEEEYKKTLKACENNLNNLSNILKDKMVKQTKKRVRDVS